MEMRKSWLRITGLLLSGIFIVLAGCGTAKTYPSKARKLPDIVETKLSVGDTRQKVRSLLGEPLIVNESLRLEVYRLTGRDTDIDFVLIYPFPSPSPYKVTAGALILYDEEDNIKEIDAYASDTYTLRISASGYLFTSDKSIGRFEPETLIGPPIALDELPFESGQAGSCSVVFFMDVYPMEIISIDDVQIADLSPSTSWMQERTFFKKVIMPGIHRLLVHQTTYVKNRDFENVFDCASGDTVYVELDASVVRHSQLWAPWFDELEGDLVISKTPSKKHTEGQFRPILWHNGVWYGK